MVIQLLTTLLTKLVETEPVVRFIIKFGVTFGPLVTEKVTLAVTTIGSTFKVPLLRAVSVLRKPNPFTISELRSALLKVTLTVTMKLVLYMTGTTHETVASRRFPKPVVP